MNVLNKIKSKKAITTTTQNLNVNVQVQNKQKQSIQQKQKEKLFVSELNKLNEQHQKRVIQNVQKIRKQKQQSSSSTVNVKKIEQKRIIEPNNNNHKKETINQYQKLKPKQKNRMTQPQPQHQLPNFQQSLQTQVLQFQTHQQQQQNQEKLKQFNPYNKQFKFSNPNSIIQTIKTNNFQFAFQKQSSNNFSNIFKTNRSKQSKNEGIYFQQNRQMRNNLHGNISKARTNSSQDSSEFEFSSILKASKQKQQVNKIRKQITANENYQEIQKKLLSDFLNKDVICLMVKKGYSVGNIHIFQGELISLKLKRLQSQFLSQNANIQRVKLKVSCNRKVIFHSQNVLRIYLKEIIFLSQNQAIFSEKFILQIVQKSQLIRR